MSLKILEMWIYWTNTLQIVRSSISFYYYYFLSILLDEYFEVPRSSNLSAPFLFGGNGYKVSEISD